MGAEMMRQLERLVMLRAVDNRWVRHLTDLDELREGIGLRAFGQQDPLVAYKKEAYEMYEELVASISQDIVRNIYHAQFVTRPTMPQRMQTNRGDGGAPQPVRSAKTLGRNDPCHCGSGKKYKNCHMRADQGREPVPATPGSVPQTVAAAQKGRQRQRRAVEARIRHAIGRRQTARQGQDGTQVERASMRKSDIAQARALLPGRLPRQALPRQADLTTLFAAVRDMHCISVVGVSNLGKSALLRSLTDATMQERYLGDEAANYLSIYIDLNQMLDMTEQAFYELILRCAIDVLEARANEAVDPVLQRVRAAYDALVEPTSNFEVPLRFAQAMAAIGDLLPQKVVFLFDELDGPVCEIDGRVFLNLRALKDKHWQGLTYVTATNRRLEQLGQDGDVAEFAELFAQHVLYISPLNDAEIAEFVARFAAEEGVTFSEEDLAFIRLWAGGHPGLLEAICRLLGSLTGQPVRDATQDWIIHRRAAELIPQDTNIQTECRNIWSDLTSPEQEALLSLFGAGSEKNPPGMDSVIANAW